MLTAIYVGHTKFYLCNETEFDKLALSVLFEINDNPFGIEVQIQISKSETYNELLKDSNLSIIYTQNPNIDLFSSPSKHLINLYSRTDDMNEQTLLMKSIYDDFSVSHE